MNAGTENRKKTIAAGALGVLALISITYIYSALFGGSTPAPTAPPRIATAPVASSVANANAANARAGVGAGTVTGSNAVAGLGAAPGVAATRLASTSSSLDPTLDQAAMLRTESLAYSGSGRNIFSATYVAPPVSVPRNLPPARPHSTAPTGPPPPPPPPATCPPSCPPINLKFFGTARRSNGMTQGFFLSGEDVYLANVGDIIVRKYKVTSINANSASIQDLQNNNTQTIPLQP